ncbi:AraC family transcriptional regulator [Nocardia donostiensis]|uniref:AraC family transcriptional regulator n=1 Tax=Nocardia donostiensis TaxID=1538463 RepID=A0A1W0BNW4_9NOCA|nr:AraC family transcriptional regulator [Nocardia donostiensis]ONM47638.1 AraC family transcriptional regulator [Nocardia donostiensis]OQS24190.1 AraC family transcriptional regulator [Nocardia donostiensis]
MDILSDAISAIRTNSPSSGLFIRHAPWGRHYPVVPGAGFHVVLQGSCWLRPPDGDAIALGVGDVVFMPRGADHVLVDDPATPVTEIAQPGEPREITGPGPRSVLLCGAYALDRRHPHPMLNSLPEFVHLPAQLGRHPSLRGAVDLLAAELAEPRAGTDAVVPSLLDALLLYILRAWLEENADTRPSGWAAAFGDPAVATALRAIHADPSRPWTVEDLAAAAGVSRATLARRFAATIGEAPLSYVTHWRMILAAKWLRESADALSTVARRAGYGSEFAFAKAFKREFGVAPGRYRKEAGRAEPVAV